MKINLDSLHFENIDLDDYKCTEVYISYAEYEDGTPLTEDELLDLGEQPDLWLDKALAAWVDEAHNNWAEPFAYD